jgi:hypothetical protein
MLAFKINFVIWSEFFNSPPTQLTTNTLATYANALFRGKKLPHVLERRFARIDEQSIAGNDHSARTMVVR